MSEALNIETEDVYEAPMVTEAGNFTELTQGTGRPFVEGPNSLYGPL
ncbi:MAG: lasso RiPP family leader peptide-containing protein [Pseudonocardiaceae bacterium]